MDEKARMKLLLKYDAPPWMAETLKNIPTHRIKASIENTPIERWHLPDIPEGCEVYIKREDLTGCSLSGNKVRGLEFLFGNAICQGCTSVCATGPAQSNMLRAMALMASSLGMKAHFVIYFANKDDGRGNNMLLRMTGAYRYMLPIKYGIEEALPKVKLLAEKIRKDTEERVYTYSLSTNPYVFGYLKVFDELMCQGVGSFSDIVLGSSGGKSAFGLAVGNHLNGLNIRIHSMVTGQTKAHVVNEMNKMLRYVGLQESDGSGLSAENICHITEHLGAGYGQTTQEELDFLKRVASETGVVLGSTYSGKAAYHLVKQLNEQPEKYKGKKILFVHTGGIFELFDAGMQNAFDNDDNRKEWKDLEDAINK